MKRRTCSPLLQCTRFKILTEVASQVPENVHLSPFKCAHVSKVRYAVELLAAVNGLCRCHRSATISGSPRPFHYTQLIASATCSAGATRHMMRAAGAVTIFILRAASLNGLSRMESSLASRRPNTLSGPVRGTTATTCGVSITGYGCMTTAVRTTMPTTRTAAARMCTFFDDRGFSATRP